MDYSSIKIIFIAIAAIIILKTPTILEFKNLKKTCSKIDFSNMSYEEKKILLFFLNEFDFYNELMYRKAIDFYDVKTDEAQFIREFIEKTYVQLGPIKIK